MSSGELKRNVRLLGVDGASEWLERIARLEPATYSFTWEDASESSHIGFIAEELPKQLINSDGAAVDVYALATATAAGLKGMYDRVQKRNAIIAAQHKEIDDLRDRLESLEAVVDSLTNNSKGDNR